MNVGTNARLLRAAALAGAVLVPGLLLAACSRPLLPADAPRVQLVGEAYSAPEVRAALIRALDRHKLVAEEEGEGRIIARFQRKDVFVRVAIEYSTSQVAIRYLASDGLGETRDANGRLLVDNRYDDLAAKLEKLVGEELKRPAKERALAEKHEREYQAMLQLARTAEAQAQAAAAAASGGQADPAQAAPDAAPGQAEAAPQPTIVNNTTVVQRKNVVINNTTVQQPAAKAGGGRWQSFCDKAAKAVWYCPDTGATAACMRNRGQCSSLCRVGGGC